MPDTFYVWLDGVTLGQATFGSMVILFVGFYLTRNFDDWRAFIFQVPLCGVMGAIFVWAGFQGLAGGNLVGGLYASCVGFAVIYLLFSGRWRD